MNLPSWHPIAVEVIWNLNFLYMFALYVKTSEKRRADTRIKHSWKLDFKFMVISFWKSFQFSISFICTTPLILKKIRFFPYVLSTYSI